MINSEHLARENVEIPDKGEKRALSELRFCGVAVLQSEGEKRLEAEGKNAKCQSSNAK